MTRISHQCMYLMIAVDLAMTIQQAEIAKNIDEIQAQAVELHKRFSIFIDKFNDIGNNLTRLNKSFNAAVGSAQSRLLPQGRRFAELAGQSREIDVADQIDEVVGARDSGGGVSLILKNNSDTLSLRFIFYSARFLSQCGM